MDQPSCRIRISCSTATSPCWAPYEQTGLSVLLFQEQPVHHHDVAELRAVSVESASDVASENVDVAGPEFPTSLAKVSPSSPQSLRFH